MRVEILTLSISMKKLIILTIIFISACSSNRVLVKPQVINDQTISYVRGNTRLHSQTFLESELTILDYSYDEMVISLTINNTSAESITITEKNIKVELLNTEGVQQKASIYSYDQLATEVAENSDNTLGQVGGTAAGIGASFIPFGSIAYSIGRLFYSIGSNTEGHQKRIDKLTYSQLSQLYFRQQTVEPESSYSGILKIGFEEELEEGDKIIFSVRSSLGIESFNFTCKDQP